jgi:TolA-binding protein
MSADAAPITFTRFSKALEDLSVESLYAKYSELTNQLTHLESSNKQLEEFARENDDRDCYEALLENKQVMKRFEERREAIKNEVKDVRGLPWRPREDEKIDGVTTNGSLAAATNGTAAEEQRNGDGPAPEGDDGVYL